MKALGGIFVILLLFFGVSMILFFGITMMAGVEEPNETIYPDEAEAYHTGIGVFNVLTPAMTMVVLFLIVIAAGMAVWFLISGKSGGSKGGW